MTGWVVLVLACLIYLMTMEATGSFWDCGEFASSAYKVQIPHPPGAPLFILIGRVFMAFISNPHKAILGINTMSALASGFTILFLFWSITHFAKKVYQKNGEELTGEQIFIIMAAGIVGAFAYAFSDSFWYSAVESEVYAMSSFLTAVVFWLALKWEAAVIEEKRAGITARFTKADRWLILIFYIMGLSIGVHILNLLTIPSIVMIYYFNRYKPTVWGTVIAFFIGCGVTGIVQKAVIQWTIKVAADFDIFFKNSLGLPFFTGFAFFFVVVAAIVFFGLRIAKKMNWNFLRLGLWIFTVMTLGTTSYFTTLIRSNADPAVDMFNVDNPISLTGYLSRDQYGDWPILYGQDFTASKVSGEQYDLQYTSDQLYIKTQNGYEKKGLKQTPEYEPEDMHIFPRMWDAGNDQGHADYYAHFADIQRLNGGLWSDRPSLGDNIRFFLSYQNNWMYWRYFLWNFAGKQNDLQGINMSNVRDGNWKTGIGFLDTWRLGDQSRMPEELQKNKANNKLYALPLVLGLLGFAFQFKRDKNDTLVVTLLFFFTGLAIAIYLNMPGNQPRERDYAFAGSFYAFAFWIGLGVIYVKELFTRFINSKVAGYAATALCILAVPVIMGNQEWDDHDRSNKTIARDLAIDYLESCAPNAILVSYGDNDTYPLWYAQEVEGIRRDVRVINQSLLGTDWYINQLRYKVNESDPIDPLWTADQIEGVKRDVVQYTQMPGIDPNQPMDLYTMMHDYAGSDAPGRAQINDEAEYNFFPTKKVTVPVDVNLVRQNGTVNPSDSVLSQLSIDIPNNYLYKNDAAILNIVAANKWKRPIYFTQNSVGLGFDQYLRQDGLTYRLIPVTNPDPNGAYTWSDDDNPWVNNDSVYSRMMTKFAFGNCQTPGVYYDEENRSHLNTIRLAYATAAISLSKSGQKDKARQILERCDSNMLQSNFPYGMPSRSMRHDFFSYKFLKAAYMADDTLLAAKITKSLKTDLNQQMTYYAMLGEMPEQQLEQAMLKQFQAQQQAEMGMMPQGTYQQQRGAFMESLTDRLRALYDESETAFRVLKMVQQLEDTYKNPKPVSKVPGQNGAAVDSSDKNDTSKKPG